MAIFLFKKIFFLFSMILPRHAEGGEPGQYLFLERLLHEETGIDPGSRKRVRVVVFLDESLGRSRVDPLHTGIARIEEFTGRTPTLATIAPTLALAEVERESSLQHDQARLVVRRSSSGTKRYGVKRVAPVAVLI